MIVCSSLKVWRVVLFFYLLVCSTTRKCPTCMAIYIYDVMYINTVVLLVVIYRHLSVPQFYNRLCRDYICCRNQPELHFHECVILPCQVWTCDTCLTISGFPFMDQFITCIDHREKQCVQNKNSTSRTSAWGFLIPVHILLPVRSPRKTAVSILTSGLKKNKYFYFIDFV